MRKLLVLMLVLGLTAVASANLKITVGGVVDPANSEVTIGVSDTLDIGIYGDGRGGADGGVFWLGIALDPVNGQNGSLDHSAAVIHYTGSAYWVAVDNTEIAEILGVYNPFGEGEFLYTPEPGNPDKPLSGMLVDNIIFHCDGMYDVTLTLLNGNLDTEDTMVIHQIPEPMTLVLLGLGGLFLRRK